MARRCRWILLLLCLLFPFRTALADNPSLVIDLHPAPPGERASVAATLSRQYGRPIQLIEPDPALVRFLRWEPDHTARAACEQMLQSTSQDASWPASLQPPASPEALFPTFLAQAAQRIDDIEFGRALTALQGARAALPCVTALLTHEQVRSLFLLEALTHAYLKDGLQQDAFLELLAVDSQPLGPEYNQSVRNYYFAALRQLDRSTPVPIASGNRDLELYIDGIPSSTVSQVWPGQHVLQLAGPAGMVRSRLVRVAPPASTGSSVPFDLSSLSDFGLRPADQELKRLAAGIAQDRLEPSQRASLDRYLESAGLERLAFAIVPEMSGQPTVVTYSAREGLRPLVSARVAVSGVAGSENPGPAGPSTRPGRHRYHLEAGLSVAMQNLVGLLEGQDAFLVNGRGAGPGIWANLSTGKLELGLRAGTFNLLFRPRRDLQSDECRHDLTYQAECLPDAAPFSASLGVGYRSRLRERLTLTPSLAFQLSYLRNTLITEGADNIATASVDAPFMGAISRARLAYQVLPGSPRLQAGLELSAGLVGWRIDGSTFLAVPLLATADLGMAF